VKRKTDRRVCFGKRVCWLFLNAKPSVARA
jgi:hypothetical protein